MRTLNLVTMALLGMAATSALAQTLPGTDPATGARPGHVPGVGQSLPGSLPPSPIGFVAAPADYLRSARTSLVAGRPAEARQSLEMAETRVLHPSVVQGQEGVPDGDLLVSRISDARGAVINGDNARAIQIIDLALSN